ncbi:DNA-binding pseudobarrel domain superfamily [Arabidopsis thaliana x Arabidopsis arenosa]|uniref:DNA-binding pseudobarrel domain superfamily n=1 Tax=Arabidopsis thaliana x Arabidopsis arenosa TaxID=1240361 RepID=A0A8T1YC74_9BRAS|nr:DNA-binding pseudobarrel domain superfamily [Arabidopsis thaliana x Arabidopsis arenosa]
MEEWEAFCEFLSNQQPPRSLSESTADDAIEFLISLPTDRIDYVFSRLSAACFEEIDGFQNENPFGSPIVGTYLKKLLKEKASEKEYGEKKLTYQIFPGGYQSGITGPHDDDKKVLFEKCLTAYDFGSLVVAADKDAGKQIFRGTDSLLQVEDEAGKLWLFGLSYLKVSQSYEFIKGWSSYVKEKQLGAGDFVFFEQNCTDSRLFIGWRRCDAGIAPGYDAYESSQRAVVIPTSPAIPKGKLDLREKLKEIETSFQQSIPVVEPVLVISCGDQDSEETYFISCISNELCMRGFAPCRYDLTRSLITGNIEMLHRSRACIMIISKNYACSRECLAEIMVIMEHIKERNVALLPVYFKVTLSDIWGQSGPFGTVSLLLRSSAQASQFQEWRVAMIELTSTDEYLFVKGEEVMLAKNIVRDVYLLLSSETYGVKLPLESILTLLDCPQPSAPQIVGLWGMAGIGKTTIAREIFRTQAERYDVSFFLPDFDLMCQTKGLSHLRDEFFSKIFGEEKVFVDTCDTKLSFTTGRFLDKKVLVVLDGVSNARDAEVLLGGFGWFSGGHTIMLTSRNKQVLVQCRAKELYEIPKLSNSESYRFCRQHAPEKYWMRRMSLISKLVNYASGIPLALRVLILFIQKLYFRNEKDYLRILRQNLPSEIQDAFRRSFNGLDDNEKDIYLDLACFFRGEDKDHVVNILDGCGFFTDLGIYGLIDESLISLVDNKIEISNIFQDTGQFVICQEDNEAGKRSRLWESDDIVDVLTNNSGTEAIEGIFLDMSGLTLELNPTVFEKMYRLRLLKLHCLTSENCCNLRLPQGLCSLPDELRLLHWERYPLRSLPRNFNPKHLVELNMPYSNIKKLWKGTKNLEKLKRIILSHCRQLAKFPRLSKARNLEHIDLEGCTSLVKVTSSILHHHKLTFLSLKDCSHLRIMPATVHLESLEVLNLSGCSELEDFQGFSPNLRELYLAGTAIREMPSSISDLTRLVILDLENCNRLQHLPPEISNLQAVATLNSKRPASSMDPGDLSSVEHMAPPYKKCRFKRVIETVILSLRKRKREKSVSSATNLSEVQLGSAPTSVSTFWDFHVLSEGPGEPDSYYMQTGKCHHPRDRDTNVPESSLSSIGLPLRIVSHFLN